MRLRPPGGRRTAHALLLLLVGLCLLGREIFLNGRSALGFVGAFAVLAGAALWFNLRWGRVAGVFAALFLAKQLVSIALRTGGDVFAIAGVAALLWLAWEVWNAGEPVVPPKLEGEPLTSFVLLLKEPRPMEAAALTRVVQNAWGGRYGPQEDKWVVGEPPLFMVKSHEALFVLHCVPLPYFEEPGKLVEEIQEMRQRHAVERHLAWISVDLMRPFNATRTRESFYPSIGRLIAELAGEDVLALYHPETRRLLPWDPVLAERLRGPSPLEDFARPVNVPVLKVDVDDPRMKAAIEEARLRLPEFVDAFQGRIGESHAVKAPVSVGGRTEHIWISVDSLEPSTVRGRLGNDPVDLGGLKIGDRVEIPINDVQDWVYAREGELLGLFSQRAIEAITREKRVQ